MNMQVETVMAVSIMLAVFASVTAVGSCLFLGVGFERLRAGFENIRKQTGFFSDMLNRLEKKVEVVDGKTEQFSHSVTKLEHQVEGVAEQANIFSGSIQSLERKVEIVDKQTGFFSEAIHKLEEKAETKVEPVATQDEHAGIKRYLEMDPNAALEAAQKAKEIERKKNIRAQMLALANDLDNKSPKQDKKEESWTENVDYSLLRLSLEEPMHMHHC